MITRSVSLRRALSCGICLSALAGAAVIGIPATARADDVSALQAQIDSLRQQIDALKAAPAASNGSTVKDYMANKTDLTWNGITLYGTVDMGLSMQSHGTPLNDYFAPGVEELISKNSNRNIFGVTPNGLSQSKVGVKVEEPIGGDFKAIAKLEAAFNPQSGDLTDSPHSLQQNNGVALKSQSSVGDSSLAGQAFASEAYVGVSSSTYGQLTLGRNSTLMRDDIIKYDPMGGSYAFSIIGNSGVAAGAGVTGDARLDDTVKYGVKVGPVRFAALAQFPGRSQGSDLAAEQFDLGFDYAGFQIDGIYSHIKDAVSLGTTATLGGTSLAATVSDNTTMALMAKYGFGPITFSGGYEHIFYANPSSPLPAGFSGLGGYATVTPYTTNAYNRNKILQIAWFGAKYAVTPAFSVTGAYYHYAQNAFQTAAVTGGGANSGYGCGDSSGSGCSGTENVGSIVADYALTKRFDVYGGAMYTHVLNGLESGFMHPDNISPMVGGRFNF